MATTDAPVFAEAPHNERPVRTVWALAWPAVALNSLQVVNILLDRAFIGRLEAAALTALGGATNVLFLVFTLAMALGTASTALVSRAFGAREITEYRLAARQCLSLSIFVGTIVGLACWALASTAANILPQEDTEARRLLTEFLIVDAAGLPALYIIQTLAGSLRGVGDTKSPMVISGLQIVLHALLSYFFIFPSHTVLGGIPIPGAGLGFVGAALGLTVSAWLAAIGYIAYTPKTALASLWRIRLPNLSWARRILRIAMPAATMGVLRVLSLTVFTIILSQVPNASVALAALPVGFALESIMFMPSFGLSMAAAALVGQSLGMKRPERAERLAWIAGHHAALVTLMLAAPIFAFAPQIAESLLPGKEAIIVETTSLVRLLCVTEIFFAYSMVMIGAMQGAGDTVRPLWITVFSLWGMRVPLAFLLSLPAGSLIVPGIASPIGWGMGAIGAWIAMSFTQMVQGILALLAFKQGHWKHARV